MWAEFSGAGGLRRLEASGLSLLRYPASELQDGLVRLYLRRRRSGSLEATPLIGWSAPARIGWQRAGPAIVAEVDGIRATVRFRLSARQPAWYWHVHLVNRSDEPVEFDLVYTHDLALAPYEVARMNEYYVSQYLDLTPVSVAGHGVAIAVRQNMPGARQPWALIGGLGRPARWATDALQLCSRGRLDGEPLPGLAADLPSSRLQHEHALATLQSEPLVLAPGAVTDTGFYGLVLADHPAATSEGDAHYASGALEDPAAVPPDPSSLPATVPVHGSLFATAPVFPIDETAVSPPADARDVEWGDGAPHAWFTPAGSHVVTAAKERAVLRPHGTLLRTGSALVPDERSVTATAWMAGSFLSHVSQGHVSRGSILSLRRTYLGLQPAHGLRIFAAEPDRPEAWSLLGVPSAWEVRPDGCRWRYVRAGHELEVAVDAPTDAHELRLRLATDRPLRLLVAAHLSLGGDDGAASAIVSLESDASGVTVACGGRIVRLAWEPGSVEQVADDRRLHPDGQSAGEPWVTLVVRPTRRWSLVLRPQLVPAEGPDVPAGPIGGDVWADIRESIRLTPPKGGATADEVRRIDAILPWFAHDALIHYLSPRGLEQFTGGGWGTRDASQGPVGLLLALGQHAPLRDLVVRLFRAQNARGDWPQWFDFYERYASSERSEAHGDVVYWPLLVLGEYLAATGDAGLLEERLPFAPDGGPTESVSLFEHVARALDVIEASRVVGTHLPAYGHGDWNDSLQPADRALAAGLVSSWTVTLQAHALGTLARSLEALARPSRGAWTTLANRARRIADEGAAALRDLLLVDGVLAGYGLFDPDADPTARQRPQELLIHPTDERTGLRYSLLPMVHAITADLLSPQSAAAHLRLIAEHLTGPDGAHLFDRPIAYRGGPMCVFQRAEAAAFFGREIGLMYTHAHLRYAEALARVGRADEFLAALALANPIGITDRVASARPRQSTTYYSSSDADLPDRYAATAGYRGVLDGIVPLEGGWRTYSSGPGIFLRLVVEQLLGIRQRGARIEIDPVIPPTLDGLVARIPLLGGRVEVRYAIGRQGFGVRKVGVGRATLRTTPLANPYREPGVSVGTGDLAVAARRTGTPITIEVG